MRDNLLFQYIKNVVKEKQSNKDSQITTFAQRYCKQQLMKKKLNTHHPQEKMTHLMKNFRDLDTYVDLPELIQAIKKWKFRQMKESVVPKPSFIIRQQKYQQNLGRKIKKQLGQKIKQKYLNDNTQADDMLSFLQKHTTIRSDGLKNNSYSNLNNLFEQVCQQGDDQTWKGNFDFLELLHKANTMEKLYNQDRFQMNNHQIISSGQKIMQSETNSKLRKEYTKLLHKVTTYLQIILQTEHKQKWDNKKYPHKSQHTFPNLEKGHKPHLKSQEALQCEKKSRENSKEERKQRKLINLKGIKGQIKKRNELLLKRNQKRNADENGGQRILMSQTVRLDQVKKSKFMTHKKKLTENLQIGNTQNGKESSNDDQIATTITTNSFTRYRLSIADKNTRNNEDTENRHSNYIDATAPQLSRSNFFKSMYCQPLPKKQSFLSTSNKNNEDASSANNKRNDSFYRTTSSFKFRTEAIMNQHPAKKLKEKHFSMTRPKDAQSKKCKQAVKQNFTFRNRNIKQKIVNKLSTFIREIDEEEHNNRRQNSYYNSAINKLQSTLSMCFGQFKQEAVACDADIENLKKYATFYNHNGPTPMFNPGGACGQMLNFNFEESCGIFGGNSGNVSRDDIDVDFQQSGIEG